MTRILLRADRRLVLLATLLAPLALCALCGCTWVDAKQRALIYRPTPGSIHDWQAITPADELLWLPLATEGPQDGRGAPPEGLRAIWVPRADPAAPAVLYLHGTFRNVFQNRPKIAAIHAAGFSVLAIDYRGFGDSSPALPSEDTVVQDGEVAWQEFARRVTDPERRAIYGHSMGGAVAVQLALRHQASPPAYGALVLESTFTSMPDIARDRYPWAGIVDVVATQRFDSIGKIGQIDASTWLLAGTADRTVPSMHSRLLYRAAARPCALVMFEGGSHSHLEREFTAAYRQVWADVAAQMQASDARACTPGTGRTVHVAARP